MEAISCGRPVITYVSSKYIECKEFPLKDVNTEEKIVSAVKDAANELWINEHAYLKKNHSLKNIIQKLLTIYEKSNVLYLEG